MSIRKLLLLFLFLLPATIFAQSGKMAGIVTDKDSGEPLVGVNIVLDGTTMGAMTGIDGYYVILNVPAGTYNIHASYIGYKDVVVEGLRVSAGVTASQNFELKQTTLELGEAVVVQAQRPLVEKNVTQSYSLVTSDDIQSIPVRGLNSILALQASVVVQNGAVHIRGGRSDEVGYYLDGASTSNALSNTNAIFVIQDAVEEIQVLTGGYTAEFGGANSGIIRSQIKSGTPDFHASVDFQTDKFAASGEKFLGTYSYQHHIGVISLSGPIMGNKIKYFIAGENNYQGDRQVRFSKGYQFNNLIDTNPNRIQTDTVSMKYPDGFTPRNKSNRYALNGSLTFDFNPINFRISGTYNNSRNYLDGAPWLNILRDRERYQDLNTYLITGKMTHVLNPTTFYELNVGAFGYNTEMGDSYLGNDWMSWYDSSKVASHGVTYRDAHRANYDYLFNGIPFTRKGAPINGYSKLDQKYFSGSAKFTTQIGRHHEIKAGVEARAYTVRSFSIAPSVMLFAADTTYGNRIGFKTYGSIKDVPTNIWALNGGVNSYGYDLYGNSIDSEKKYSDGTSVLAPKKPLFGALFIQDKIEYDDLIINAGLRLDYYDSDDRELIDPADIKVSNSLILANQWKKVDPFVIFSPRLGFSFPVSERTVFYFQYGKFAQLPNLSQIYTSNRNINRQVVVGGNYFGSPIGFGLDPVRTTNYEIGFRHQLSEYAALDITGFYRNIKGQIQVIQQKVIATGDINGSYARLANGDFATTKGLELKLVLRRVNRLQAQFNYTLTDAEGSGSNSLSYRSALERATAVPTVTSPLDYSQTHRGSVNLDYRFGRNDGGKIFERFGANLLFTFNSGHPYTLVSAPAGGQVNPYTAGVDYMSDTRSRSALEPINTSTTPWNFLADLRLDKTFTLTEKLDATVYMRVNNLFNTKNVINVYQKTGSASDDGYLSDPTISGQNVEQLGPVYVAMYKAINQENGGAYRSQLGLDLYGQPRQIFFGIKLTY